MDMADTNTLKIVFLPENSHVHVLPGTTVLEAAGRANIIIETPCGGKGTCGQCRVIVRRNAPPPNKTERSRLSARELEGGVRLACQALITEDIRALARCLSVGYFFRNCG